MKTQIVSIARRLAVFVSLATVSFASPNWHPGHYVLSPIGQGTTAFHTTAQLAADPKFTGVQRRYWWRDLESGASGGVFDFSQIISDALYVHDSVGTAGTRYFVIQIQIKDFSNGHAVPTDMWNTTATTYRSPQKMGNGQWAYGEFNEGTNSGSGNTTRQAMYWLPNVKTRLQTMFTALKNAINTHARAADLNATIESIVLNETACEEGEAADHLDRVRSGYTQDGCVSAIESNLSFLHTAFPNYTIIQYINFLPPADSTGGANTAGQITKLGLIATYAAGIDGVGIGCPDVRTTIAPPGYTVLKNYQNASNNKLPISGSVQGADYKNPETRDGVWKQGINAASASPAGLQTNYFVWLDQDNHDTSVWGFWIGTTITDTGSVRLKVSNSTFQPANAAKPTNVP